MPQLSQFTADTLPDHLACQIRAFIRIEWYDSYAHAHDHLDSPLHPVDWHPAYFALTKQHALISCAAAVWRMVDVAGEPYKTFGLGDVMTYPAFRKKGYGQRVVAAATDHIKQQPDADLAILWAEPSLESFYNRHGWAHPTDFTVTKGALDDPRPTDFPMLLFLSERARALRPTFASDTFYFGPDTW